MGEERLGGGVDLRMCPLDGTAPTFVLDPIQPNGPNAIVSPGESGRSTLARALALSKASGREIIPDIQPVGDGSCLYIAGEDPVVDWHARSVEAIARGAGIDRRTIANRITLLDMRGRKLHRIGRTIAEMAGDYALVILDSQQSLLPSAEASGGGVRARDSLFFDAVDAIARPVLIVAHPNLAGARRWDEADGRVAGSEVNRDRLRMSWRMTLKDEPATAGTSFRRYTATCTKWNHGPRPAPVAFAAAWTFGVGGDPGSLAFTATTPVAGAPRELTPVRPRVGAG